MTYSIENLNLPDESQIATWLEDMVKIRRDSSALTADNVNTWLQNVKVKAEQWGKHRILPDIIQATEATENTLASEGNFLSPIFRNSIPKLVNALCEHKHSLKTSTFRHVYKAKNGDMQTGEGIPNKQMVAFKRNKLKNVEITYFQLDGTDHTIRIPSIEYGRMWRNSIVAFWADLSNINQVSNEGTKNGAYRALLSAVNGEVQKHGHPFFPKNVRAAIHELQDRFHEPRTAFQALV